MYGHSTCFVLRFERDWFHFKSPSDPSVFIVGPIFRSEDCQPEQQSAHQDNHWWSNCWLHPHHGGYLHTVLSRFGWLMFLFRDMEDNIMQLNGEFELQLTIETCMIKCLPRFHTWTSFPWLKCSVIQWRRMCSWIILSHSISVPSRPCCSIPFSCCTMYQPIKL